MKNNKDFTATRLCDSETLYRFFVATGYDENDSVLLTQIDASNKAIPCPRVGEEVMFDLNTPINNNEETKFYIDEIYRVKSIAHCYSGESAHVMIDIVLEVIPFDNN